jgi:hypothetical protein
MATNRQWADAYLAQARAESKLDRRFDQIFP